MVIELTQGKKAIIDAHDWPIVSCFHWYAACIQGRWYAVTNGGSPRRTIRMHRIIMGLTEAGRFPWVDHCDGDGLNNQRKNLRICSPTQNNANNFKRKDNSSGFRGVFLRRKDKLWVALIRFNKRLRFLGAFKTRHEAARRYDREAVILFGKFARLNFP